MRLLRILALPVLAYLPIVARADAKSCSAGTIVFGDPTYNGTDKPNPKGQTVKQDPPLEWRNLVLAKGKVYTVSGGLQEVWGGDVAGTVKRLAGTQVPSANKFIDGPCADARFLGLRGVAALKDGSLVVADGRGNAVRTITDPEGPGCTVATLVGPPAPYDVTAAKYPGPGDVDGPAKDAKIAAPSWVVVDAAGNIYFLEETTAKLKKIAADAARTVSTLTSLKATANVLGRSAMILVDKKLYVTGNTISHGLVWEVDPETKATKIVKNADGRGFPGLSNSSPSLMSITSDGKDLILFGQGYIWRMTRDGKTTTPMGGIGYALDYPDKYDLAKPHSMKELALRFRTDDASAYGTSTFMVWSDNALYFRGRHLGAYVLKIGCQ
jgi:hypothetical protein